MVKNNSGEKSVFQCFDCKNIMKSKSPFEKAKNKRNSLVKKLQTKYIEAIVIFRELASYLRLNTEVVEEILDKLYLLFHTKSLPRKNEKTIVGVLTYIVTNSHNHIIPQSTVAYHLGIGSETITRNKSLFLAKLNFYNALD